MDAPFEPRAEPDLSVDLCGVRLDGPLVLGSGGIGECAAGLEPFQGPAAAVVTRSLRMKPARDRARFPSPHLALGPRRGWLLNCEWGNLQETVDWAGRDLAAAAGRGLVIVSVSGRDVEDCAAVCRLVAHFSPLIEINVSCSHSGLLNGHVTHDLDHVRRVLDAANAATSGPVLLKLGWSTLLPQIATVAAESGAAGIVVTNSIGPGLDLDLPSGRPTLGVAGGMGGMSGKAIFPIALECVREVVSAVDLPVVGVGGITSAEDVVKMLMVGATCVQLYTSALLGGPSVFTRIRAQLVDYMKRHGLRDLSELRGRSTPWLSSPSSFARMIPHIDAERCTPCGACVRVCPHDAISMDGAAAIQEESCTGCGLCVGACPPVFDAISLPFGASDEER